MKLSTYISLTAACVAQASILESRAANWTVGQTVNTTSGPVSGQAAANQSQVSEYLGIPFAQKPIGDLRFAPPVVFNGTAAINGTKYGPSCPVKLSNSTDTAANIAAANITEAGVEIDEIFSNGNNPYDEDCLYLNVWTQPQAGDAKKAVLVWIYGGGFNGGSSAYAGYSGDNIAALEDVVVVSFNYRLSILGFPGNPDIPNNVALLDQRLAVEWIRDNIENFGGDASRITLFGQSAGSVSVDLYNYAWANDTIAHSFISESGTVFSWGLPNSKDTAADAWFKVSKNVGCGDANSDSATVLSCMRSKNYTDLLNNLPSTTGLGSVLGDFVPTADDVVVFSNYSERTPSNNPIITGNNDYEAGLFRTDYALAGLTFSDGFWDFFTLQEFTCPAAIRANASVAAGITTYRYRYFGIFPNTMISSEAGAWHGAELSLLFDTMPSTPASTTEEIAIADYMRGAWATFAKDPVNGLTELGWPTYNASGDTLIRLAFNNMTGTNAVNPILYDVDCSLVNVSSTNEAANQTLPTTTAISTATSTPAGTGTSTGSAASATASKAAGPRLSGPEFWALAFGVAAYFL